MSLGDYAAGTATLVAVVVAWSVIAVRLRAVLCPGWHGAAARLAEAVLGAAGLVVVAELLGAAGQLRRLPAALASVAIAVAVAALTRRVDGSPSARPAAYPRAATLLGAGAGAMAVALVVGQSVAALHGGPFDTDSLHYHLSAAAHFVQTGSLTDLHRMSAGDGSAFYPFNAELLDALAMLGPRPDIATVVLNPAFAVLALTAAWVFGDRYHAAPAAVAAVAVAVATPLAVGASSGPGLNDLPAAAFLLAAVAVLVRGHERQPAEDRSAFLRWPVGILTVAGAALGLAAGTKLTLLAPVALVAVGVVVAAKGGRPRAAGALVLPALATGAFWYVRDWALVGSPLPGVDLSIVGMPGVPTPYITPYNFSVAHYLTEPSVVRHWYLPQLRVDFGVLWPLFLALPVVVLVVALLRRTDSMLRIAAVTVVGGFVAYLVTPTTAIGPPGRPVLFGSNVRYALPELALGLALVAVVPRVRVWLPAVCALGAALTATYLLEGAGSSLHPVHRAEGVAVVAVLVAVAAGARLLRRRSARPALAIGALTGGVLVAVAALAYPVQQHYLQQRYAGGPWAFTRGLHDARIALVGFPLQYPLYGDRLDNRVQYVAQAGPRHAYDDVDSCRAWGAALAEGGYDYVVVELTSNHDYRPFLHWTNGTVVAQQGGVTAFRLDRGSPMSCG